MTSVSLYNISVRRFMAEFARFSADYLWLQVDPLRLKDVPLSALCNVFISLLVKRPYDYIQNYMAYAFVAT
jgi:hypothetical protein